MTYVTPAGIRDRLTHLLHPAGHDPRPEPVDDAELADAAASAQAEVAARVAHRYRIPTDPAAVPRLLVDAATDIAAWLYTVAHAAPDGLPDTHPATLRYRRAVDLLDGVATGRVDLPDAPAADADGSRPAVRNPYHGRLYGLADFDLTHRPGGW